MNIDKKTCINIGIVAFLLYLAIHYWDGLVGLFNLFLAAAGTLINGAIIAYVLNILMRFYERHMAPNTKKKVWNAMRRPVCMALAFLTLVAVIVALIQIILPQLISCVQVLLSSLPGVLRQMYDKLMENPTIAALMVAITSFCLQRNRNGARLSSARRIYSSTARAMSSTRRSASPPRLSARFSPS